MHSSREASFEDSDSYEDSLVISGNNILHELILGSSYYSHMMYYISLNFTDVDQLKEMAGEYNNKGELPLHLLSTVEDDDIQERNKVYQLLLDATPSVGLPLNEMIDWETIRQMYQPIPGSQLEKNLRRGWEAGNYARKWIQESSTHPDTNRYDRDSLVELTNAIDDDRQARKEKICRYLLNIDLQFDLYQTDQIYKLVLATELNPDIAENIMEMNVSDIKDKKRGDCGEFRALANHYLYHQKVKVQSYRLENGDHNFSIIDHEDEENGVAVDAWSGEVCPKWDLNNKLRNFVSYSYQGKEYTFTPLIKPGFHIPTAYTFGSTSLYAYLEPKKSPLDDFAIVCANKMPDKEKFVLMWFIVPILKNMLKDKQIEIQNLYDLKQPEKTLLPMFLDTTSRLSLLEGDRTINALEDEIVRKQNKEKNKNRHTKFFVSYNGTESDSAHSFKKRRHTM